MILQQVGNEYIKSVLRNKNHMILVQEKKIKTCIEEINSIENDIDKDKMYGSLSLAGKPFDSDRLSKTNNQSDLSSVLERYRKSKEDNIAMYNTIAVNAMEEIELINFIWTVYLNLDHKLYVILHMLYEKDEKWDVVAGELKMNNKYLSAAIRLGLTIIKYEVKNGKGTGTSPDIVNSKLYKSVYCVKTKVKETKGMVDGQIELDLASNE